MKQWTSWNALLMGLWGLLLVMGCGDGETEDISGGEAAILTISPGSLEFPSVALNGEGVEEVLMVMNTGLGTLNIRSIRIVPGDGGNISAFHKGSDWVESTTLAPEEQIYISVNYAPTSLAHHRGFIEITSNDPNSPRLVPLNTQGLSPQLYTPDTVSFHRVPAGAREWQITTVQNIGFAPLHIDDFQFSGSDDFQISFPNPEDLNNLAADGENWPAIAGESWPLTLAPDAGFPMRVTFSPESDDPSHAEILISSNDPTRPSYKVNLIGNSGAPCILVTDEEGIVFTQSTIGTTSNRTITIENCSRTADLEVRDIAVTDDGGGLFAVRAQSLPGDLPDQPVVIPARDSANFVLGYTPLDESVSTGQLTILSDDPVKSPLVIPITGTGTNNSCPTAVAQGRVVGSGEYRDEVLTTPLENVEFSGAQSDDADGTVARYEWSIITRPQGSLQQLTPNNAVENPRLWLDLAGTYEVELVVYDNEGLPSCEPSIVTIHSVPDEEIHIQLVWNIPSVPNPAAGNGTDLDLHYLHPTGQWDNAPGDIHWKNRAQNWGTDASPSPVSLDIDDLWGMAPENINHTNPVPNLNYAVGVYYFHDKGKGASEATVRIYVHGQLAREFRDRRMQASGDFWYVGFISWPSGDVTAVDTMRQGFP